MARKPQVAVEPRSDGRWAVQSDGSHHADSLHDTKSGAVRRARELAANKRTELVIKNQDGRIADRDSYTRTPNAAKGSSDDSRNERSANTGIIQSKATVFETALKKLANR